MGQGLTANPSVNEIIDKLNQGNKLEGKPLITEETIETGFNSYAPSEIEQAYLAQKPSLLKLFSLRVQSYLRN